MMSVQGSRYYGLYPMDEQFPKTKCHWKVKLDHRCNRGLFISCLGGSFPLIFCIHVHSGPIYWGGYLPCRKDYKVMVFYM